MKKQGSVRAVVTISLVISTAFYYIPGLSSLSPGFVIIICTLAAAGMGAYLFPLPDEERKYGMIPKKRVSVRREKRGRNRDLCVYRRDGPSLHT